MKFHQIATILLPILSASASAQLQVYPRTETDVAVFTNDGSSLSIASIPKSKLILQDRSITASGPGVVAGAWMRPILSNRGLRIREFGYVDSNAKAAAVVGTAAQTTTTGLKQAKHSFVLSIRGQAKSNLTLTALGSVAGTGRVRVDVDIDLNNKIDFSYIANGKPSRTSIPFKGSNPRKVRITIDAAATKSGSSASSYELTFLARIQTPVVARCFFARFGKPCSKMTLDGLDQPSSTQHGLVFNAAAGPATAPHVLILGATPTQIGIATKTCPLYTLPLFALVQVSSAAGDAQWTVKTPLALKFTTRWQVVSIDKAAGLGLSNGLRVDCF